MIKATILKACAVAILVTGAAFVPAAQAKGCLKGAAVGGVAGHVVGHHGVIGAAAGCAIGSHRAKVKDQQEAKNQAAVQQTSKEVPANEAPTTAK